MSDIYPPLIWLSPGQDFPDIVHAWDDNSSAPGLLAAGGTLDLETLKKAYRKGIFPWFSVSQPILWWSPDPRMVLDVSEFRVHISFWKVLKKFCKAKDCEVRIDTCTNKVIEACAASRRNGQTGTWIVTEMIDAYEALHRDGAVHSVETWVNNELVGGLYCVALGGAVFGESMFARSPNASKIALAALVAFCREHGIKFIDCQQNTAHLASLGAKERPRAQFINFVTQGLEHATPVWQFNSAYWSHLLQMGA